MAKWFVAAKKADFDRIGKTFGISPVTARILRNRGLTQDEEFRRFLYGTTADLYPPEGILGMKEAAELLEQKIREGKRIRVIGDYDADGVCSACILHRGLAGAGAEVDTAIPNRMKDGYGLNEHLVLDAWEAGIDTIVTCDNGIAAGEQIALAKEKGMTVVVTDHHEVPYEESGGEKKYLLPPADVVVDPKQDGDTYPYKGICGAVVAYKLILCLYGKMGLDGEKKDFLDGLLELAAFATVCDVMELLDENRIIVRFGIAHMKHTANEGLRALMEVNGIEPEKLTSYTIGFVLGPCINATGRLDTAVRALRLLEETDRAEAVRIASELKALNDSRKEMTEGFVKQAIEQVENGDLGKDRVLVIFLPDCHESLAGIIAGRVREKYYKPVFVLTRAEDGVKGSGRSIETYHMFEEMTKIKELFTRYGGHKMAAGLSIRSEDVDVFRRRINEVCTLTPQDLEERIHIDVPMPVSYITRSLVDELDRLEPFGNGNPRPLFAQKDLLFLSGRVLGKNGNAVRFTVQDDAGGRWEMVAFGDPSPMNAYMEEKFGKEAVRRLYGTGASSGAFSGRNVEASPQIRLSVTYYPSVNTWKGDSRLQLVMRQYQ
ncbi:MAG TPA: single-stranded-DNA-specific exonuclease RecJ [Candidatus Eisenbergiella merdipullorum]|uniref:Single-stranded-DNA-specific exonuclease RecJ n=1 Tax=Candidatus Eisenbergiella merdipullorum TaxID=2838553 RepID=A0A9D2L293_9FIRM|nr:single-stranded-DNA-specific exonuclease RecJ [Candidatus Eisenbergiella merdipullorum]